MNGIARTRGNEGRVDCQLAASGMRRKQRLPVMLQTEPVDAQPIVDQLLAFTRQRQLTQVESNTRLFLT
jgi:hypothetical protein